jgi:hypothetical protein
VQFGRETGAHRQTAGLEENPGLKNPDYRVSTVHHNSFSFLYEEYKKPSHKCVSLLFLRVFSVLSEKSFIFSPPSCTGGFVRKVEEKRGKFFSDKLRERGEREEKHVSGWFSLFSETLRIP